MATNTAASFTNHTGNATAGPFSISFSYLDEDEVDVTVGGVLKTKTTHYTFPSATTISFTSGNHPANGVSIKFQRNTDISAKKVDFQDGSVLTESDLDNNSDQILYGLQEHLDTTLNDLVYRDGSKTFTGNIVFEGASDDAHETTLAITDPTADRTITLPNTTGTVVTTGDTGTITSTMINDGTIATADLADNSVTMAKLNSGTLPSDVVVNEDNLAANSVGSSELADDAVDTAAIADNAVTMAKLNSGALPTDITVASANIVDGTIVTGDIATGTLDNRYYTETELDAGQLDNRYYTETEADARFYNLASTEEIQSGETWVAADNKVATTSAIDNRIVDLVDDVGGFVPLVSEATFPAANPDVNNGAGTIVSVGVLSTSYTPSGGTVTIPDGTLTNISGSNVTITDCGSTVLASGHGVLVETTTTLHTYKFHRLTPKATEVTTVAGNTTNINTVAGNNTNINTVAGINANITTVAGISSNVTSVAGKATEIGRLGTADAVADMAILGTTDVVADLNTLGTADVVSDMNTLAVSGVISDMDTCATNVSNINTVSGSITNVNNVGGSIANVNTVAGNLSGVNDFGQRYRAATNNAGEYSSNNDVGDLYFNTDINAIKVWNGSAWVAGVTDTGDYAVTTGDTFTGNLKLNDSVELRIGTGDDLKIYHDASHSYLHQSGTGELKNRAAIWKVVNEANSEIQIKATENAAVELYYDHSKKLETTSAGVTVTGTFTDGGLTYNNTDTLSIDHSATDENSYIKIAADDNRRKTLVFDSGGTTRGVIGVGDSDEASATSLFLSANSNVAGNSPHVTIDSSGNLNIPNDSGKLQLGTSQDLQIYHDGTNSTIVNTTGELVIRDDSRLRIRTDELVINSGDNSESIIYAAKDGAVQLYYDNSKKLHTQSGGVTVTGYIQMDGTEGSAAAGNIYVEDNGKAVFGDGSDLQIYHDGSNSKIHNNTGRLDIETDSFRLYNHASSENMIDGEANGSVNLYYDNVKKLETTSGGVNVIGNLSTTANLEPANNIHLLDSKQLLAGASNDLQLYHTGTDSFLNNDTGQLYIRNNNNVYIQPSDGENGVVCHANAQVELYYNNVKTLTTAQNGAVVYGPEGGHAVFELYADEGDDNSDKWRILANENGNFHLQNHTSGDWENNIVASGNGSVDLYYDGSLQCKTASYGLDFADNKRADFGDGNDLLIYHDGTNSYLDNNTGSLDVLADSFRVANAANSEFIAKFTANGSVELRYDDSVKLQTFSGGVYFVQTAGITSDNDVGGAEIVDDTNGGVLRVSKKTTSAVPAAEFYNANGRVGQIIPDGSSTTFSTTSDYRLKENQVAISDGITRLKTLKPYRFNFKADPSKTVDGFFAHEVTAVPEAVYGTKDGTEMQSMDYGRITPLLTAALKEAIAKIEALETKVAALESA